MVILYKPFTLSRIVFCTLFLCFFLVVLPTMASGSLFTVEEVKVDVTAANALQAKEQAFEEAKMKAFEEISARMLTDDGGQELPAPDPLTISTLIQDFEVTNEQLSSVRYVGTYRFRFKDSAVKKYFAGQGLRYTDVASKPILILPFYQRGEKSVLWSHDNLWAQAWNRSENLGGVVPVAIPLGDLADVRDIGDDQAMNYSDSGLSRMLERYGAGEAVLAIAVPDQNFQQGAGTLTIHLYRTDRLQPEYVQEIRISKRSTQSLDDALNEGVRRVQKALQRDWKNKTAVSSNQNNRLKVKVSFENINEWIKTQRALKRVYGVNEIALKSLSPKSAVVDIIFQGTEERLRLALEQADMTLARPRIDATANSNGRIAPMIYELYLNSAKRGYSQRF